MTSRPFIAAAIAAFLFALFPAPADAGVINRACHMDAEGAMALETAACAAAMLDPATEERIKAFGG